MKRLFFLTAVFIFLGLFASSSEAQVTAKRDVHISATGINSVGFRLDFSDERTNNPSIFSNIYAGNHVAYSRFVSGYDIKVGSCAYDTTSPECIVTTFNSATCDANLGLCSFSFNNTGSSQIDSIYKIVWRYDVPTAPTGDILIKRVGTDLYASSAPVGSASAIDSGSMISTNPNTWTNLSLGNYIVYATYNSQYSTSYGTCTYLRGASECAVSLFSDMPVGIGDGRCDQNIGKCRVDLNSFTDNVSANRITKVVFKYDPVGAVSVSCSANISETTIGTSVTWSFSTNLSGSYTRLWSGDESLTGTGVSAVKSYTTLGIKNASIQLTSGGSIYSANCTPVSVVSSVNNQTAQVFIDNSDQSIVENVVKLNTENANSVSRPINFATSTGSQVVYFPFVQGYTLSPLYCTYQIGTNNCNNLVSVSASLANGWYRVSANTTAGNVTEFISRYVPSGSTYNLQIERLGEDQTPATAPVGYIRIGSASSTNITTNPFVTATSSSGFTVYAPKVIGYSMQFGTCSSNASMCSVTSYGNFNVANCNVDMCWYTVGSVSSANNSFRISFRYIPTGTPAQTGSSQILTKRVGEDLYASSAPSNSQSGVDDATMISANPYFWTNMTTGTHSVYATYLPNYVISRGTCSYDIGTSECFITTFQGFTIDNALDSGSCNIYNNKCRLDVVTSNNKITKVAFKYTLSNSQNNPTPTTNSGDVIIYKTGNDLLTSSAPSGTVLQLNAFLASSSNPAKYFEVVPSASISNYVFATKLPGIGMDISYCQYDRGSQECVNMGAASNQTCDASWCAGGIPVSNDRVTKVFVRYYVGSQGIGQIGQNLISVEREGQSPSVRFNLATSVDVNNTPAILATTTGIQRVYVPKIAGYNLSVGTCQYDVGGLVCGITSYTDINTTTVSPNSGFCDTSGMCRRDFTVSTNKVTRVLWRYTPIVASTGNVKVEIIGADQTIASAPSGVIIRLDNPNNQNIVTNPYIFSTTTPVSAGNQFYQRIYAKKLDGYDLYVGTCRNNIGSPECLITNFDDGSYGGYNLNTTLENTVGYCNSDGFCRFDINIYPNEVSRVVWRYVSKSQSQIKIERVGLDGSLNTVPVGTYAGLGLSSVNTSQNPAIFSTTTAGYSTVIRTYVTRIPGYTVFAGTCVYGFGEQECNDFGTYGIGNVVSKLTETTSSNFSNQCSTVLNICEFRSGWGGSLEGKILRTVFFYSPNNTEAPDGTAHVKVYRSINSLTGVDTATTIYNQDGSNATLSGNPILFKNINSGQRVVYFKNIPGYTLDTDVSYCQYDQGQAECAHIGKFNNQYQSPPLYRVYCDSSFCSMLINTDINKVTKIVLAYTPLNQTGSVMMKRVGTDLYASSAPVGTSMRLDNLSPITTNPYTHTGISAGTNNHTVYATYLAGQYLTSFGFCTYQIGASECAVTNFTALPTGSSDGQCDGNIGLCKKTYSVEYGKVTKVVAKYDLATSRLYTLSASDMTIDRGGNKDNTISAVGRAGAPATPVNFQIQGLPTGVTAIFSPQTCSTTCQTNLKLTVNQSVAKGKYTIVIRGLPDDISTSFILDVVDPTPEETGFTLSCNAGVTSGVTGKAVYWNANVTPTTGSYSYVWSGDVDSTSCNNTKICQKTYDTSGIKTAMVQVTSGGVTKTCSASIPIGNSRFFEF